MIRTRFPPEPNGYLHAGHIKSMYYNFGYPFDKNYNGKKECYLRFDDTNPKTEKQEYEDQIVKDVLWMGYVPDKVTNTSDYFDKIYELTLGLIKDGLAYMDFSSPEEMQAQRHKTAITGEESPHRNSSIEYNLEHFIKMKDGGYTEGGAVLRLKIPKDDRTNDCMIDPIAYRVIDSVPHYRTGNNWKIYPTYEYSHYIVDSLEGITHSFCTLEFFVRRPLSYWVCNKLGLNPPEIIETNRLDTDFGTLSKRKIKKLLENNNITGWDDPRLLTVSALRNKGISPSILKDFCNELGYTQNASAIVPLHKFQSVIRNNLNKTAPRRMIVEQPIKVTIKNYDDTMSNIHKPVYPHIKTNNEYFESFLGETIYIEKDDFRTKGVNKKYKRFAPGRVVRIKYGGLIKYIDHQEDNNGNIININVHRFEEGSLNDKIWGTIHWVSYPNEETKIKNTVRCIYYEYPDEINDYGSKTESKVLLDLGWDKNRYIDNSRFQMERIGYFYLNDSDNLIFLCSLREDSNKD